MNPVFPSHVSTEVLDELNNIYENQTCTTNPETLALVAKVKEHYKGDEYVQEVQDVLEEVFGTDKVSLPERAMFCRDLAASGIAVNLRIYPFFKEVVQMFGPILFEARGFNKF